MASEWGYSNFAYTYLQTHMNDGAKPKSMPRNHSGGGCFLEGGVFSGTYGTHI